jgi:hypothetical protein
MNDNYEVVTDAKTLRLFEKLGFITFHHQTLKKITNLYGNEKFTCYYVDEGKYKFEHNGNTYGIKFFDGCFCPYVVKYLNTKENDSI